MIAVGIGTIAKGAEVGTFQGYADVVSLSSWEMVTSMPDVTLDGTVRAAELRKFLEERCEGLRIGNVDVIVVQQENLRDLTLYPALEALAGASGTRAIVVEYFAPELERNARRVPVFGKLLEYVFGRSCGSKTCVSGRLAEIARETGKPIAVADIANKPGYFIGYALPAPLSHLTALVPKLLPVFIPYAVMWGINRLDEHLLRRGLFDRRKVHGYERLLLDIEDARRVFVAMGVHKLAEEYQADRSRIQRILVCYPRAHALRISQYLRDTSGFAKLSRRAKQLLYRLYPAIDISVRQYGWKDTLARVAQDPSLASWQKFSERSL